jgi:hypothetical protein
VANTLKLHCNGAVGFIGWLDVGGYTSSQSLINFKVVSGDNLTLIGLMHLF